MNDLPHKERQIDLVLVGEEPKRCVRSITKVLRRAGFENIRVMNYNKWSATAEETGYSGLPPQ